jgi:formate hydrogenlyase subunit 4
MAVAYYLISLALAPLLPGVISRVKATFAGRRGRPYLQMYHDLAKLCRKGEVYSTTTSWLFRAMPPVSAGCALTAMLFVPLGGARALVSFTGDFFLVAYLLAMARFATILAALDTGSAFEGMGASREAAFSALAEPVLLVGMVPLAVTVGSFSLTQLLAPFTVSGWNSYWPVLLLLGCSFFLVLLSENSRIPVDDPDTHLELTMIHEAMILDHGGVDLAFIEFASAVKLWFFCAVVSGVIMPDITVFVGTSGVSYDMLATPFVRLLLSLAGIFLVAACIGVTESTLARLKLVRVPQLLGLAGAFAALACIFCLR